MIPDSMAGQSLKRFFQSSSAGHGTSSTSSLSASSTSSDECSASTKKQKRQAKVSTFEKWKRELNMEHKTSLWLRCDKDQTDKSLVSTLWCEVCRRYEDRLKGMRNYSGAWISGSTNYKTSNVIDHSKSDQHTFSMARFEADRAKAQGKAIQTYAPIARALLTLDAKELEKMKRKFEICYVLAREGLAFLKYPAFHALAAHQGVEIGSSYRTPDSAKVFTHFIAEAQRKVFLQTMVSNNFFSFLMDGSTDSGNTEQELVLVTFCEKDEATQEIKSCTRYLIVVSPETTSSDGLVDCLAKALERIGCHIEQGEDAVLTTESGPILVGGCTDGASVNIGVHTGMKTQLQSKFSWLFWGWCFSHRLELACKDSFTSNLFKEISEMLLRLYYLYKKSAKKSHELEGIVEDLSGVYTFPGGGNLPVRCQGTRWISHKRRAIQRVVDRYGVYIAHLTTLARETNSSVDRARITGYLQKWCEGKMIIGCAMYVDALKPASILSLLLQEEGMDIVQGLQHTLKAANCLQMITQQDPSQWPTVKRVMDSIVDGNGGQKEYQGSALLHFTHSTISQCSTSTLSDLSKLESKIKERLAWSDLKLLRSILVFLDTHSWTIPATATNSEGTNTDEVTFTDDKKEIREAVQYVVAIFRKPLEAKGATLFVLDDEVDEIVDYCRKFVNFTVDDYKRVWYILHTTHDAYKWPNLILLSELLFSLPFTNAKVERTFSNLKVIKNERRTSLLSTTLDDLMEIASEGPPFESFSAENAVTLWFTDTNRRPNQKTRKCYKSRANAEDSTSDPSMSSTHSVSLEDWDDWFKETNSNSDSD